MHQLERLTALELRQLLDGGTSTVVVPFGSIEHHGGHLPIGTDALLADAIGGAVAKRLGAVLAPTQRIGDADLHLDGYGTLTLGSGTLTDVATVLATGLVRHGFQDVVLLSTHGGNAPALRAVVERLEGELPERTVLCAPEGDPGPQPGAHSGEWITSVMLALHPDLVNLRHADKSLLVELQSADAQRGRDHFERFVTSVVRAVRSAT